MYIYNAILRRGGIWFVGGSCEPWTTPSLPTGRRRRLPRRRNPRCLGATFHICRSVLFRNVTAQRSSARMFPHENPPKHYVDRPPTPTTARFINPHIDNIKSKHPGRSPSAIGLLGTRKHSQTPVGLISTSIIPERQTPAPQTGLERTIHQ
jgi:hypothetical protein